MFVLEESVAEALRELGIHESKKDVCTNIVRKVRDVKYRSARYTRDYSSFDKVNACVEFERDFVVVTFAEFGSDAVEMFYVGDDSQRSISRLFSKLGIGDVTVVDKFPNLSTTIEEVDAVRALEKTFDPVLILYGDTLANALRVKGSEAYLNELKVQPPTVLDRFIGHPWHEARTRFLAEYCVQLLYLEQGNARKAADRAGVSERQFIEQLYRVGFSMKNVYRILGIHQKNGLVRVIR